MHIRHPTTNHEYLARMLAEEFHEESQATLYLRHCLRHDPRVIHRALAAARAVPDGRVRKSRAAIFFFILKQHRNATPPDPHPRP